LPKAGEREKRPTWGKKAAWRKKRGNKNMVKRGGSYVRGGGGIVSQFGYRTGMESEKKRSRSFEKGYEEL